MSPPPLGNWDFSLFSENLEVEDANEIERPLLVVVPISKRFPFVAPFPLSKVPKLKEGVLLGRPTFPGEKVV